MGLHSRPLLVLESRAMSFTALLIALQLFGSAELRPQDVRQGVLGSCFFHASIAALVQNNAEPIKKMILEKDGTYQVTFPDRSLEPVYPADVQFARDNGYDRSNGLWVSVLLRAYGQRVLREGLRQSIEKSNLGTLVKTAMVRLVTSTDLPLLAYDRAIRSQIAARGKLEAPQLKADLTSRLSAMPVPQSMADQFIALLDSKDIFKYIEQTVNENGEVFGAYRALGNGGLSGMVLATFTNSRYKFLSFSLPATTQAMVRAALSRNLPATASSAWNLPPQYQQEFSSWYAAPHAYTILRFDAATDMLTLRNPWGDTPGPDGVFTLPFSKFMVGFAGIWVAEPGS